VEHRPAGDRCGRVQKNVGIVESRRNGPRLSMRHDDDDNDDDDDDDDVARRDVDVQSLWSPRIDVCRALNRS